AIVSRLDSSARGWETDGTQKSAGRNSTGSIPALNATRARVVFGESKRQWFGFVLPPLERASQVRRAGFEICSRIEELLEIENLDLVFTCPFIGGSLTYLHQFALARLSLLLTI